MRAVSCLVRARSMKMSFMHLSVVAVGEGWGLAQILPLQMPLARSSAYAETESRKRSAPALLPEQKPGLCRLWPEIQMLLYSDRMLQPQVEDPVCEVKR